MDLLKQIVQDESRDVEDNEASSTPPNSSLPRPNSISSLLNNDEEEESEVFEAFVQIQKQQQQQSPFAYTTHSNQNPNTTNNNNNNNNTTFKPNEEENENQARSDSDDNENENDNDNENENDNDHPSFHPAHTLQNLFSSENNHKPNVKKEGEKLYCICKKPSEGWMISCSYCEEWFHGECVGVEPEMTTKFQKGRWFCPPCGKQHGYFTKFKREKKEVAPTRKSTRNSKRRNYKDMDEGESVELLFKDTPIDYENMILTCRDSAIKQKEGIPLRLNGEDLTIENFERNGFRVPILIEDSNAIGIKVPANTLTVRAIKDIIGERVPVSVIRVALQQQYFPDWTMDQWTTYYHTPATKRKEVLNVISLEVSDTPLREQLEAPTIVRELDWIEKVWPSSQKQQSIYPKVQYYCLMSVKGSYTDFHIDFGGSSVWYHVLRGKKIFYLIEPTDENIMKYKQWSKSSKQSKVWFGNMVDECIEVVIDQGQTMFIPSGWIHAVSTPKDSLVFGGNFLHYYGVRLQFEVNRVEDESNVEDKFRYPHFMRINWYALMRVNKLLRPNSPHLTPAMIESIDTLIENISIWIERGSFVSPPGVKDPKLVVEQITAKFRESIGLNDAESSLRTKAISPVSEENGSLEETDCNNTEENGNVKKRVIKRVFKRAKVQDNNVKVTLTLKDNGQSSSSSSSSSNHTQLFPNNDHITSPNNSHDFSLHSSQTQPSHKPTTIRLPTSAFVNNNDHNDHDDYENDNDESLDYDFTNNDYTTTSTPTHQTTRTRRIHNRTSVAFLTGDEVDLLEMEEKGVEEKHYVDPKDEEWRPEGKKRAVVPKKVDFDLITGSESEISGNEAEDTKKKRGKKEALPITTTTTPSTNTNNNNNNIITNTKNETPLKVSKGKAKKVETAKDRLRKWIEKKKKS